MTSEMIAKAKAQCTRAWQDAWWDKIPHTQIDFNTRVSWYY